MTTKGKAAARNHDRLYPTEKEEREYREFRERYGSRDALVVKCQPDKNPNERRSLKQTS